MFTTARLLAAFLTVAVSSGVARAEYPERAITIVACFPVGGGNDIAASPYVFVVPEQSKFKTMKEFIAFGQANPGKLNWTSPGAGTTPQLAGEILKARALPVVAEGPDEFRARIAREVPTYKEAIDKAGLKIK